MAAEGRPGEVIEGAEGENARLRQAVSDLTLEKQILKEAASGNF
jgi:putative transposase